MPLEEQEVTAAQGLQRVRRERFAPRAADRIRGTEKCLFSLLPHEELSRLAGDWYEACTQAMLRGNYAPIDFWVRSQAQRAAEQGFALEDLFQLLSLCRDAAIELESWNEDILSSVEEVIEEVLQSVGAKIPWRSQDTLDSAGDTGGAEELLPEAEPQLEEASGVEPEDRIGERRKFARNRLRFPIRVKSTGERNRQEVTQTHSVSRGGLYFVTAEEYQLDQVLRINFPYWNDHGGINEEYAAKVIRIDRLPKNSWGVGVDFHDNLGSSRKSLSSKGEEDYKVPSHAVRSSTTRD